MLTLYFFQEGTKKNDWRSRHGNHTCNLSTWEIEAGGLKPDCAIWGDCFKNKRWTRNTLLKFVTMVINSSWVSQKKLKQVRLLEFFVCRSGIKSLCVSLMSCLTEEHFPRVWQLNGMASYGPSFIAHSPDLQQDTEACTEESAT
jgi:hypothetical protein